MSRKKNLIWNRCKRLPFEIIGGILSIIYFILAWFGYNSNLLIIIRIIIATIVAICFYLAIKKESEKRGKLGFTGYHFVLACAIFWAIFNAFVFFTK